MFWYEDEVKQLEKKRVSRKTDKKRIVFYGSSSMRLWASLKKDFPSFDVINQSFGGSTLAACCHFFKRLVPQYSPDIIIIYAGDNDLGDGRHPEEVLYFFKVLMGYIQESCGDIPVAFLSVKPSRARYSLNDSIKYTNLIIRNEITEKYPSCTFVDVFDAMLVNDYPYDEFFEDDGLHISPGGYKLWKQIINEQFLTSKFANDESPVS